jgi:glutaredoxin
MEKTRIYSVENCPYCTELKNLLIKEGIPFVDVNVSLPENEAEFKKLFEITKCDDVPMLKVGKQLLIPNVSFKSIKEAAETTKKILG